MRTKSILLFIGSIVQVPVLASRDASAFQPAQLTLCAAIRI